MPGLIVTPPPRRATPGTGDIKALNWTLPPDHAIAQCHSLSVAEFLAIVTALPLLLFKMVLVATIVVLAAMAAERTRPMVAAMIATLPFSIGATYVLLALEHEPAFLGTSALKGVASACATVVFIAVYALAIPRLRPLPAVLLAYAAWVPAAWVVYVVDWSIAGVSALTIGVIGLSHLATRTLTSQKPGGPATRSWMDVPVRALGVAVLVGGITQLSHQLGPDGVGTLANFPIIMSSLGLIMHLRLGSEAAAGMLANSVWGMMGGCIALLWVHLTAVRLGVVISLATGLAICIVWNLMLLGLSQRHASRLRAFSR